MSDDAGGYDELDRRLIAGELTAANATIDDRLAVCERVMDGAPVPVGITPAERLVFFTAVQDILAATATDLAGRVWDAVPLGWRAWSPWHVWRYKRLHRALARTVAAEV